MPKNGKTGLLFRAKPLNFEDNKRKAAPASPCWNGSRRASAALNRRQINLSKQQQKTKVNLSGRIPCV
jgi:hypothetical protein